MPNDQAGESPKWVSWLKLVSPPDHWNADGWTLDTVLADPAKWGASKVHATDTSAVRLRGGIAYCGTPIPPDDPDALTYWTGSDDPAVHHTTEPCKRCLRAAEKREV